VGPRAGLDTVVKIKVSSLRRDPNLRSSRPYPNAIPLSYSGFSEDLGVGGNINIKMDLKKTG
jgi:hypothetical protein